MRPREPAAPQPAAPQPAALILAGGRGSRWGGQDKGLIEWEGDSLAAHVARHLRPYCAKLFISCNRNQASYAALADYIVNDLHDTFEGPLAGILATLDDPHLQATNCLLCSPCDTPLLGTVYGARMLQHPSAGSRILIASAGQQLHYLHMLLPCYYKASLETFFREGGRSVKQWLAVTGCEVVDFDDQAACFRNLNRPEDCTPKKLIR
jgi:molybdenum cofactor guanylyltransferase